MRWTRAALAATSVGALLVCVPWLRTTEAHNPITTTVLFHREVAQILNAKCAPCHKADGLSMPLQTFDQVRPWAIAIKEEILARHMPPWPAERGYGTFANDGGLTLRELEFLISWIDGGTPRGEKDPPNFMDHSGHWMLGTPTRSYTASPVGASPLPGYKRYVVGTRLATAMFVRALDFKPGDTQARAAFYTLEGTGQYLGGWTPTHPATEFPPASAVRLPANARVLIDVLVMSSDQAAGAPELALYAANGAAQSMTDLVLTSTKAAVRASWNAQRRLLRQTTVFALRVHMSEGGDSIEVRARRPDGSIEPLLLIREFAAQWQTPYVLRQPLTLPAGAVIEAAARDRNGPAQFAVHVQVFEPAQEPQRLKPSLQGKASHSNPVARLGRELVRQGALSVPTRADSAPTLVPR